MVFNTYGTERLIEWKKFRDSLETSQTPLEDVAEFWSRAPFVNPFLDPKNPSEWPDPWHLILDGKLDDLAICLGMLYTIKLTQRFIDTNCEIHMSMLPEDKFSKFFLIVNNKVLNYEPKAVKDINVLGNLKSSTVWAGKKLP